MREGETDEKNGIRFCLPGRARPVLKHRPNASITCIFGVVDTCERDVLKHRPNAWILCAFAFPDTCERDESKMLGLVRFAFLPIVMLRVVF